MLCFALAALLALVCEASLVCRAEEEDGYSDDDVDSVMTRGRRPREYRGPQLLDEITIASATSSTSTSTSTSRAKAAPYGASSSTRHLSAAELEAAEAAARYSRSSRAAAEERKAGARREGKREGKRWLIGGGGPSVEERQALERE